MAASELQNPCIFRRPCKCCRAGGATSVHCGLWFSSAVQCFVSKTPFNGMGIRPAPHENDGKNDQSPSKKNPETHAFGCEERSQYNSHHRIHVSMCRDQSRRAMLEQPHIGA